MTTVDQLQKIDITLKDDVKDTGDGETRYVPDTPEERKLLRKIDRRLLPMLWVMYIMNYLDRTNIGNAKVGGMEQDLNMSSSEYSLVLSIFFVCYLLFEVPSNMILTRSRPSLFLPAIMFLWGSVSTAVAGIDTTGGLVGFRFVLGMLEAGFFPGVMLLMSCWYKPLEMSKRLAIFYTASLLSGAFGGLLAGGIIDAMDLIGGVRGWRWLFIIEGLATVVFAGIAVVTLPDYPSTTKWLSEDERQLAVVRLAVHAAPEAQMSHKAALISSLKDPRTWAFMITYNLLNSVGTISYFFPTLMNSLGYTGRMAQFMTVPIYCVSLVIALIAGFSADKTGLKAYHVLATVVMGTVSFIICVTVPNDAVRYTFICFGGAGIWGSIPVFLSWMVTMFEPREKRAVSIAFINGFGALSSVYGSFFWASSDAPRYIMGFAITTSLMAAVGFCIVGIKLVYGDRGLQGDAKAREEARNATEET